MGWPCWLAEPHAPHIWTERTANGRVIARHSCEGVPRSASSTEDGPQYPQTRKSPHNARRATKIPKRPTQPDGCTVDEEPDDVKAARLLAAFRYMVEHDLNLAGWTIGGAQFMVIRYRPAPAGPHNPDADLSGPVL